MCFTSKTGLADVVTARHPAHCTIVLYCTGRVTRSVLKGNGSAAFTVVYLSGSELSSKCLTTVSPVPETHHVSQPAKGQLPLKLCQ